MREVVFHVVTEEPGHLEAQADTLPLRITAPTFEDLQHEAREALIEQLGPAHCSVRVRVRRRQSQTCNSSRSLIAAQPRPANTRQPHAVTRWG